MAHFCRIENNVVTQVIVVSNEIIGNAKGLEGEPAGIEFCKSLYGADTEWLQTSYNASFRGKYAGVGYLYDAALDEFVEPVKSDPVIE